ncbi:transmembrane regulator [Bordetella pertussis]|nr:transmembrane regulator [Bordetella pertussis]
MHAPNLAAAGYHLMGGRLLPGGHAFRFTQDGPVRVFYWVEGKFGYALSGELERDALLKVAQEVYRELG